MSKIEYAKFQFMILVLRALLDIMYHLSVGNILLNSNIREHVDYLKNLMEEK